MSILVTGGAGFIGSHTVVELLNRDYDVVIIDNLCNSNAKAIERIKQITRKSPVFYQKDVRDEAALEEIFTKENIEAVIHFAGLKAVGESVAKPLEYYRNNLESTLALCEVMRRHDCKSFIFSSANNQLYNESELWASSVKSCKMFSHSIKRSESFYFSNLCLSIC